MNMHRRYRQTRAVPQGGSHRRDTLQRPFPQLLTITLGTVIAHPPPARTRMPRLMRKPRSEQDMVAPWQFRSEHLAVAAGCINGQDFNPGLYL